MEVLFGRRSTRRSCFRALEMQPARFGSTVASLAFVFFFLGLLVAEVEEEEKKKTFIFLVDPKQKPSPFVSHSHWYSSLLPTSATVVHHHHSLFNGFSAARLTVSQARSVGRCHGVVAALDDYLLRPHTTRSPSFLGLDLPASRLSATSYGGSAAVIGVVDTGIWLERPSFSGRGLGPLPRRWQGRCDQGAGFNRSKCNRKVVGARAFFAGYAAAFGITNTRRGDAVWSVRDHDGHGTHVASIAAGAPVDGANFYGFASGIARGVAPHARIAIYKACWDEGCMVSDVVAAVEAAVSDGVDVLSLSIGAASPAPSYELDPLAVATFRATIRGVFVSASAGNGGPAPRSVGNIPPWITAVGAGTIDRDFPAVVLLGNGTRIRGTSISLRRHQYLLGRRHQSTPVVSAGIIAALADLTNLSVAGFIVFWKSNGHVSRIEIAAELKRLGAVATIVFHGEFDPDGIVAEGHVVPTVTVGSQGAATIDAYLKTVRNPTAVIYSQGTAVHPGVGAPVVASFSARGPNPAVPWVLKPDLLAPGVDILGAWTGSVGPSGLRSDARQPMFSVASGTSMSCPHVSGVAALVRSALPEWSPGEIRSALMTTAMEAGIRDEAKENSGGPLAMGAGYLCPERAADPGLVYDLEYEDYVELLCGLNYTARAIDIITGRAGVRCGDAGAGLWGFNYPAFVASAEDVTLMGEAVFQRRLRRVDVGKKGQWYRAEVASPEGYAVEVEPRRLWFARSGEGERVEFRLALRCIEDSPNNGRRWWWRGGSLTWREEGGKKRRVKSPIVVFSISDM
ncbi:subtilisin-like protease SBT1.6 [Curcuma longa]|uniref:subtilisin-like protease SBT1.6 n=1 Tax=Curcuma longa TaxID=136217 RepID=UPI003D9F3293